MNGSVEAGMDSQPKDMGETGLDAELEGLVSG